MQRDFSSLSFRFPNAVFRPALVAAVVAGGCATSAPEVSSPVADVAPTPTRDVPAIAVSLVEAGEGDDVAALTVVLSNEIIRESGAPVISRVDADRTMNMAECAGAVEGCLSPEMREFLEASVVVSSRVGLLAGKYHAFVSVAVEKRTMARASGVGDTSTAALASAGVEIGQRLATHFDGDDATVKTPLER